MRAIEIVGVAVALVGLGIVLGTAPETGFGGLHADLFPLLEPLCLEANHQQRVEGALGGLLLPGHERGGHLRLVHCDPTPENFVDLDLRFRTTVTDHEPSARPPLDAHLIVSRFQYGEDNLLATERHAPDDRNLIDEIDANPQKGNGDGRLSLRELSVGVNDLPPPGPEMQPTPFGMVFLLDSDAGNDLQGDIANFEILFRLSDTNEGDVN